MSTEDRRTGKWTPYTVQRKHQEGIGLPVGNTEMVQMKLPDSKSLVGVGNQNQNTILLLTSKCGS
jgi:hypothetical protein